MFFSYFHALTKVHEELMYIHMYHMKIEEITRKTQNQKRKEFSINFIPEGKEHNICKEIYYRTGQCKRRWAIEYLQCTSRYKDAILYGFKTQQKKCSTVNNKEMDLSTYCNCTTYVAETILKKNWNFESYFLNLEMFNICDNYLPKC